MNRYLRDNTEGHSMNVVQKFALSGSDESLLCFQEGSIIIPTLNVKGILERIQHNENSQPLRKSTQLCIHLLNASAGLHGFYLGKVRDFLFEHPGKVREDR